MAGHEADEKVPGDVVDHADQVGKVHVQTQVPAVGVHVLAQKGDLLIPGGHQLLRLGYHVLRPAGPLPPPDVGHHAVGAEVVAAVHDGEPGLHAAVPFIGDALRHHAVVLLGGEDAFMLCHHLQQQLREAPQLMGAKDQIHHRVGLLQFLGHVLLLHHAAADGDDLAGAGLLAVVQSAHIAQHPHFRVFPDGAGVDHDHIRLKLILGEAVAHHGQVAPQLLAVGLVLLAAVGIHHGQGAAAVGGDFVKDLAANILLGLDGPDIDHFSLVRHRFLLLVDSISFNLNTKAVEFSTIIMYNVISQKVVYQEECHACYQYPLPPCGGHDRRRRGGGAPGFCDQGIGGKFL